MCHEGHGTLVFYDIPLEFNAGDVTCISQNVPHTTYSAKGSASLWSYIYLDPIALLGKEIYSLMDDTFSMPSRHTEEDFYHRLDPESEESAESVARLNAELDGVLKDVSNYFQQEKYAKDNERAMRIFCGPASDMPSAEEQANGEESAFWLSYWDYFMFDYHLLADDRTPLRHY